MALTLDQKLELVAKLEGLGVKAITQLEWVLDNEDDPNALIKAAESVLDRIGLSRQSKQEIQGAVDFGITIHHRFPPAEIAGEIEPITITHREGKD